MSRTSAPGRTVVVIGSGSLAQHVVNSLADTVTGPTAVHLVARSADASRILRLTLLAPDIVKAVLDRRQPAEFQLDDLLNGFPLDWEGQPSRFG